MHLDQLRHCLESLEHSRTLLHNWGLRDPERGWRNLTHLANAIGQDALRELCHPLGRILPRCPDPDMALNNIERFLANPQGAQQLPALLDHRARSLETALRRLPDANLACISVPGEYAVHEARKALDHGLHVFLFSAHVDLAAEASLKNLAAQQGLLVMGPDCGTAVLNGVPLGFANQLPRGPVGLIAASGTGLQQVSCLLVGQGIGVSQAIGVGGRDVHEFSSVAPRRATSSSRRSHRNPAAA